MEREKLVTYLYRYKDNAKFENSGFIKMNRIPNGQCRVHIGIRDYIKKDRPGCQVFLFKEDNDDKILIKLLDDISVTQGMGELKRVYSDKVIGNNSISKFFDGIIITYGDEEQMLGTWKDKEYSPINIIKSISIDKNKEIRSQMEDSNINIIQNETVKSNQNNNETNEIKDDRNNTAISNQNNNETNEIQDDKKDNAINQIRNVEINETQENRNYKTKNNNKKISKEMEFHKEKLENQNICEKILDKYPGLPQFGNSQIIKGVKIEPRDIGQLDMANWRLGVNSFLSHGYYNYKYIMLAKIEFLDKEYRYVIGVPGIYNNKQSCIMK